MINSIFHHPYIFTTIAALFLCSFIIMIYEIFRAIKVPDYYEQ